MSNFRLCTYNVPSGSSAPSLTTSAKREFSGWMGWDGVSKVSFKFLYTYILKIFTNIPMGFKVLFQVGDRGQKFQNYCRRVTLKIFDLKVRFLFSQTLGRPFLRKIEKKTNSCVEAHKTLNFQESNFSVPSKSRANLHSRPEGPSLRMDGFDGMGYQKCPSIFDILCGYIGKVYTYLYMQ